MTVVVRGGSVQAAKEAAARAIEKTTPDAPELAVAEKPAPDTSPAPAGKQPPRPRRVARQEN